MVKAGKIIGIAIIDHIIIGNGYYSFCEAGKMEAKGIDDAVHQIWDIYDKSDISRIK